MSTVAQLRDAPFATQIYLIMITLLNSGPTLYFSTKELTVDSQEYQNYLESVTGLSETVKRNTSAGLNNNVIVTFKNDPYQTDDHLILLGDTYPFEYANIEISEAYLEADGTPSTDKEILFSGKVSRIYNIDKSSFDLNISTNENITDQTRRAFDPLTF